MTRRSSGRPSASTQSNTWPDPGVGESISTASAAWYSSMRSSMRSPAAKAWIRNCTRWRIHLPSAGVSWPCSCTAVQAGGVDHLDHPTRRLVPEQAQRHDLGREAAGDVADLAHRDLAGRRGEHEADGVGAHGHRQQGVLLVGDAADLHEHPDTVPARPPPTMALSRQPGRPHRPQPADLAASAGRAQGGHRRGRIAGGDQRLARPARRGSRRARSAAASCGVADTGLGHRRPRPRAWPRPAARPARCPPRR